MKPAQVRQLERLSQRRISENQIINQDTAKALASLSRELGRQVGLLIDRTGHVTQAIVGDAQRIYIPELDRSRSARMRGLRLVHTHLSHEPLTQEDLYDLTLLRLDYITAITITHDGLPERFYSAHVLPGEEPGYLLEDPVLPGQIPDNLRETLANLENMFRKEEAQLKTSRGGPRAFLVGVYTRDMRKRRTPEESMAELRELCYTAGVTVVDTIIQKRSRIDAVTLIGSGKVKEIAIHAVQKNVDHIIFDLELSPAQATRLSAESDLKIIDRTQLILDIFSRNARSRDGKLQVELAQLRYLKGRLSETDDNMSRLTGGIGGRGPGETKLEIGRRRVNDRITRLEKELKSIRNRRELNRQRRAQNRIPVVSIVGYTNAGKSTLLNALTKSDVKAENKLFATLDPTTRRLRFPEEREIILSDTVGFIHDLPPELSRAFEATLEELEDSDLLLHCIDAADPTMEKKIAAVEDILQDMNLLEIPTIMVFNKVDLVSQETRESLENRENSICVSASTDVGLEKLLEVMEYKLFTSGKGFVQP